MGQFVITQRANADNVWIPGYRQEIHLADEEGNWKGSFGTAPTPGVIDPAALSWRDVQTVETEAPSVWAAFHQFGRYLTEGENCCRRINP